jgi:hypothetical protein
VTRLGGIGPRQAPVLGLLIIGTPVASLDLRDGDCLAESRGHTGPTVDEGDRSSPRSTELQALITVSYVPGLDGYFVSQNRDAGVGKPISAQNASLGHVHCGR